MPTFSREQPKPLKFDAWVKCSDQPKAVTGRSEFDFRKGQGKLIKYDATPLLITYNVWAEANVPRLHLRSPQQPSKLLQKNDYPSWGLLMWYQAPIRYAPGRPLASLPWLGK